MHELDETPYVSSDEEDEQLTKEIQRSKSALGLGMSGTSTPKRNSPAKTPISGQAPFLTSVADGI